MIRVVQKRNVLALLLAVIFMVLTIAPISSAQRHHRYYRRGPSKTKHIAVGTAIGAVGGALLGGKKGALIGAGAGAGGGYLVYRHKKHHRRY
ncbi:MAG TPA: YMGG-like glycine zipper-containing protein [Blastocatellia bacterium]|nr:YMGG-like glycine zipper-containing protein [Blastocatellia bacterium]